VAYLDGVGIAACPRKPFPELRPEMIAAEGGNVDSLGMLRCVTRPSQSR
jgi:hypothetical protein